VWVASAQHRDLVAEHQDFDVWVPETLHSSCDLLILVDQPVEPVASSDVVGLG
jgi:hypothetical protein